jgi:hypothetical protein
MFGGTDFLLVVLHVNLINLRLDYRSSTVVWSSLKFPIFCGTQNVHHHVIFEVPVAVKKIIFLSGVTSCSLEERH